MPIHLSECTELAAAISPRLSLGWRLDTLRALDRSGTQTMPDSTSVFFLDGTSRRDDCILVLSPGDHPAIAGRGARGALAAQRALGEELGAHICVPLLADDWNGRSFAVYPRYTGYSRNRFLRRAQTMATAPVILDWLAGAFRHTVTESRSPADLETRFFAPLQALAGDPEVASDTRQAARAAALALESGRARPLTCLQHCDLWHGNILFARAAFPALAPVYRDFRIIDWAASKHDGYPGIDAIRFLISAFGSGPRAGRGIARYCAATGLSRADIALGCLASLGRLSGELDNFPKPRFLDLLGRVQVFLARTDMLGGLAAPAIRS